MEYVLAKDLRDTIIQNAILGKLTEHHLEDLSIFNLVEKAKKEMKGSSIDGRKVKKKEISHTNEFDIDIPDNWTSIKLGEVCIIARGGSPRPINEYITNDENGINWIKIGDTEKDGKYIYSTKEKIKPEGLKKSRMVHIGDFLLTNSMSFGRPYILKTNGCIHDGWLVISQPIEVFNQDYLYLLLSSNYAYIQFCGKVSGAVVKNLNSDKVANSVFPLPPIEEQQRIVDKVNEIMTKIDEYEKIENQLVQLKEKFPGDMRDSILQSAMGGKLTKQMHNDSSPSNILDEVLKTKNILINNKVLKKDQEYEEAEELFDIPETWLWTNLGKVCVYAFSGKSPEYVKVNNGNYTLGQAANQNDGIHFEVSKFCSDSHKEKCDDYQYLEENDTLLNTLGGGSVGRVGIYHNPNNYKCLTDGHIFVFRTNGIMNSKYFYYYMKMNQKTFEKMAEGSTNQSFLKLPVIKNYPIPVPPIEEQQRIVDLLDKVLPLCETIV